MASPGYSSGLRLISKDNWNGQIAICDRVVARAAVRDESLSDRKGVYMLVGAPTGDDALPSVYIGLSERLDRRVFQHKEAKIDWLHFVALLREGHELTNQAIAYIESDLLQRADEAQRSFVVNKNRPVPPKMSPREKAEINTYIQQALNVLQIFGIDYFRSAPKPPQTPESRIVEYHVKARGISAEGYLNVDGFVVRKGSKAAGTALGSMPTRYTALRQQLAVAGVLQKDGSHYVFTRDQTFSSPSAASCVVGGNSTNGWIVWKDKKTGKSLANLGELD